MNLANTNQCNHSRRSAYKTRLDKLEEIVAHHHTDWVAALIVAALLAGMAAAPAAPPPLVLQTVYEFGVSLGDGYEPLAGLVEGSDGSLYGTTAYGGPTDGGTVFKVTPGGQLTTLVSFSGPNGSRPLAGLARGSDGNFYGTTYDGGLGFYPTRSWSGYGTAFRITPDGVLTTLVSFNYTNGAHPQADLVLGKDGNFYGTTESGGGPRVDPLRGPYGFGTVFKMTPEGVLTTLVAFNFTNGYGPDAGVVQGSDGSFYDTTFGGGAGDRGTVFKITPDATLNTLVSFKGTNGSYPRADLVQGSDGNFYGTTEAGGAVDLGTVFRITPDGVLTLLVSFNRMNGCSPQAGMVEGSDGNLYGTTFSCGPSDHGTVFQITPEGALTTLDSFSYANYQTSDGGPVGSLVQSSDRNFYGTTWRSGADDLGTIFRLVRPPIISAMTLSNGNLTLNWNSFAGGTYQVEYAASLPALNWTPAAPEVTATGATASLADNPGGASQRYYRVRLLP